MKLQITITSSTASTKSGISKTNKPYQIIEQSGMCTFPNGEIRRTSLQLDDNEPDLLPGIYEPKDDALYPGKFDKIMISMRARDWQRVEPKK